MMLRGGLCSRTVANGLGLSGHVSHQQLVARGTGLRVLDAGTGTGMWAIDFADEYVDTGAQVVGNDLSPIQPRVSQINQSIARALLITNTDRRILIVGPTKLLICGRRF
jgi:SAM-dependent methyltransferase